MIVLYMIKLKYNFKKNCTYIRTIFEKTKKWTEKSNYQNIQTITCKDESWKY